MARGGDDLWFTSDDKVVNNGKYSQNIYSNNQLVTVINYNSALNPSAELFADELIESYTAYHYDTDGQPTAVLVRKDQFWDSNFGEDGIAFTSDDNVVYSKVISEGRTNYYKGTASKNGGLQLSSTDPLVQYIETDKVNYYVETLTKNVKVAADGGEAVTACSHYIESSSRFESYQGDCETGTLSFSYVYTSEPEGDNTVITRKYYNAEGVEQHSLIRVQHYDNQENLILEDYTHYAAPYYIHYRYNEQNVLATQYYQHPGSDGEFDTADDLIRSISINQLNQNVEASFTH